MSGSNKKDPSTSGGGGAVSDGGDDDDDDEEEGVTSSPVKRDGVEEESGNRVDKETKRVPIFRFVKAKKKLKLFQGNRRKWRRKKGSLVNSGGCFGRWEGSVGGCLCMKQPQTLDSSGESTTPPPTSDPNSKEFTYDMLKVFIEKNDFYAADCNPHLDAK